MTTPAALPTERRTTITSRKLGLRELAIRTSMTIGGLMSLNIADRSSHMNSDDVLQSNELINSLRQQRKMRRTNLMRNVEQQFVLSPISRQHGAMTAKTKPQSVKTVQCLLTNTS